LIILFLGKIFKRLGLTKILRLMPLDRLQAMAMLKELVNNDLIEPSYVSMVQAKPDHFQIQIKCNYNKIEIE